MPALEQTSVRYVKNGRGGQWWRTALENAQAHLGWSYLPPDLLLDPGDFHAIEELTRDRVPGQAVATRDLNDLRTLLLEATKHIWLTFEDGYLWWCTLRSDVTISPTGETESNGHFWLTCDRPWSNRSLGGRLLTIQDLPGTITKTAGYRGTVCGADPAVLRVIQDQPNPLTKAVRTTQAGYIEALASCIRELSPKDFEDLVDLVLLRSGWARTSVLGKTVEGIDLEAENVAAGEVAFVQVKCAAGQAELDDYTDRFLRRRERYDRMFFAVHSPAGQLTALSGEPIQVWDSKHLALLSMRTGLGERIGGKLA